jgi:hypothetical protein
MNGFFWTFDHLGWGIFALAVFTGLWCLMADLVWRINTVRIGRLAVAILSVWLIGAALILLGFYLVNR